MKVEKKRSKVELTSTKGKKNTNSFGQVTTKLVPLLSSQKTALLKIDEKIANNETIAWADFGLIKGELDQLTALVGLALNKVLTLSQAANNADWVFDYSSSPINPPC